MNRELLTIDMESDDRFVDVARIKTFERFVRRISTPAKRSAFLQEIRGDKPIQDYEEENDLPRGSVQILLMMEDPQFSHRILELREAYGKATGIEDTEARKAAYADVNKLAAVLDEELKHAYPDGYAFAQSYRSVLSLDGKTGTSLYRFAADDSCKDSSFVLIPLIVIALIAVAVFIPGVHGAATREMRC
jgi:hypothetical protein